MMKKFFCEGKKVYLREIKLSDTSLIFKWKQEPLIQKMALGPDVTVSFKNQFVKTRGN